MDETYFTNSNR